jgi:16S rRNA (uracil1498-N3)-methyltransferase
VNRFFVPGVHENGARVRIEGGDAHHVTDVLRLRDGDRVEIVDSAARAFVAVIEHDDSQLVARLVEELAAAPTGALRVDVAQALPKGAKMDFVVEKATELGAGTIMPFSSERTVARAVGGERVARWRRIAKSSAEQCGRREIPEIFEPCTYEALLARFDAYDAVLFAWETAERAPLRETLPALVRDAERVLVIIGPEGGFTHAEAAAARERGASVISLGQRILRTETGALALLAVLAYERPGRSERPLRRSTVD